MPLARQQLCGAPHVYAVAVATALGIPRLAESGAAEILREHWELVRTVFDVQYYAWRIHDSGFTLILRHRHQALETDPALQRRWALLGTRSSPRAERLRERVTCLSGFMQTLLQTASRRLRQHCGGPGTWWAPRYRGTLLADDSALLAAICAIEHGDDQPPCLASSRNHHHPGACPRLAAPPASTMPDGEVLPRDSTPFGIRPPPPGRDQELVDTFREQISSDQRSAYAQALDHAWALGRPESLSEAMARLGRNSGRGRSRRLRELDDDLGLCGVWG